MQLVLEQSFATAVRPSMRVLQTASMFGLGVDDTHRMEIVPRTVVDLPIPGPGIVFITGPSGGGKSTVLHLIANHLRAAGVRMIDLNQLPPLPEVPLVDVFDVPLAHVTSLLAMAGLGDAFLMLRTPSELSDGQRARLRIAHAMWLASSAGPAVVMADEFSATLDRLTATIIARNIRRWIDRAAEQSPITFIAATTHDDLLEALQPDVLIEKGLGDEIEAINSRERKPAGESSGDVRDLFNLRIEAGSPSDYKSLAAFHYRSARFGAVTATYRLVHEATGVAGRFMQRKSRRRMVGVLLRTLPHLGCALRNVATCYRYRGLAPREAASMLNREVRTIARVVIHPQWRGLGLAAHLVRHALAHPEAGQVFTEALAAMGPVHPFFEKAGMTRYDRPPRKEHARLLDALARLDIEPFLLASPDTFLRRLREHDEPTQTWFEHEVARWANSGARRKRHQPRCNLPLEALLQLARDQLLSLPVYYIFQHTPSPQGLQSSPESEVRRD